MGNDPDQMTETKLGTEIDNLLKDVYFRRFNPSQGKDISKELTGMFHGNLIQFLDYLYDELAPKLMILREVLYKYSFESPLDFIMIKSDFKRFFESFTQARLSMLYSLELHKDSIFIFDQNRKDTQL